MIVITRVSELHELLSSIRVCATVGVNNFPKVTAQWCVALL